jgi:thiol-disulfide isomerase/thioredoxin
VRAWLAAGAVLLVTLLAGTGFYLAGRVAPKPPPEPGAVAISPGALLATGFADLEGRSQTLAAYAGRVVVLNFWATWCAPCREEMPGFVQLQSRWADRGIQFVGLAYDDPTKVAVFGRELGVNYPLWVGGPEVMDTSRRLGNRLGVLPHTVILGPGGEVLETRIGLYRETDLEARLAQIASARSPKAAEK